GRLILSSALDLADGAVTTIGFAGDGFGRIDVNNAGGTVRNGTLALDVASGATAGLVDGDEFRIFVSTGGFSGQFDTLTGFDTAGAGGFALVEDGQSLFLRYTTDDLLIGNVVTRADLPAPVDLPDLPTSLTDAVIDETLIGGPVGEIAGFTRFRRVDIEADLVVGPNGSPRFPYLEIYEDLDLDGTIEL
ncbi:MAG: hypothetical protein AAFX52_16100, partial [Pseudomonadota bacterium]